MIKQNKKLIIITLVISLLPIIAGLIMWNRLPDMVPTHFGANGVPNGWSSKAFTVFAIPAILAALQMICIFATCSDPKRKNIGIKAFKIVLWIIPATSILCNGMIYAYTLNSKVNIELIVCLFMGILFIVLGNVLPKNKLNYTFGNRTPWALNDEANWNFSNRLAGYCFVIGGILIIIFTLCGLSVILFPIVALMVLIPFVASFIYYLKHKNNQSSESDK